MIGNLLTAILNFVRGILESILNPTPPAAPTANDDSYVTARDVPLIIGTPGVLENDTDPNGLPLTAQLVTGPANGTLILNTDGSFVYTPNLGFEGTDSFTYRASNGFTVSNVATVTVTVLGPLSV